MDHQSPTPPEDNGNRRIERINHWIRVIMAVVIPTVFIVGMIGFYFKYR